MKKSLFFGIAGLLILASCEKQDKDVFFLIGDGPEYEFSDIELYDTSTHILYFKKVHNEFITIEKGSFTFFDKGEPIYSGSFVPGYSSFIPNGPFIMSPPAMFGNYALKIENWLPENSDKRSDPKMINVLNEHNLLHSGLAISSSSIEISGTQLSFRFTVQNHDQNDLMIIDYDKTGPNLFHYFTNGLAIYDPDHKEVFRSSIEFEAPDPWNSWETDWLSELKSGESRQFTIIYPLNIPINPGVYDTTFEFPGLAHQVTKDQLYQGNSRVWLGGIAYKKRITLN